MNISKALAAAAVAAVLTVSQAMAADSLTAGKPAGVQAAQGGHSPSLLLIGAAAVVTIVAVVVATQSSDNAACGTACSTPTSTG